MKLRRNNEVALKVWINDSVFADETWVAMTAVEGDSAYVLIKDPGSPNTLKIKITQYDKVEQTEQVEQGPTEPEVVEEEQTEELDEADESA